MLVANPILSCENVPCLHSLTSYSCLPSSTCVYPVSSTAPLQVTHLLCLLVQLSNPARTGGRRPVPTKTLALPACTMRLMPLVKAFTVALALCAGPAAAQVPLATATSSDTAIGNGTGAPVAIASATATTDGMGGVNATTTASASGGANATSLSTATATAPVVANTTFAPAAPVAPAVAVAPNVTAPVSAGIPVGYVPTQADRQKLAAHAIGLNMAFYEEPPSPPPPPSPQTTPCMCTVSTATCNAPLRAWQHCRA